MTNKLASSAGNLLDDNAAASSFSLALRASGRKDQTVATYLKALEYLGRFTASNGMPPSAHLTTEHLREYFNAMFKRGLQNSTISIHYRALQQFYKWLVREGERSDNPLERIPPPRVEEKLQPHYSTGDMERVLKRLPAAGRDWRALRNRAVVLTLYDTGLRSAEVCNLRREDLDLNDMTLRVRQTKTGVERLVAISAITAQAIDRYLRHRSDLSPWLFLARDGRAMTTNALRVFLDRLFGDAGLNFRGVHAFRRGFAITFLDNGGDPEDLRTLAGWESPQMLRRYTRATETQRAHKAHRRFSPVASLSLGR
jgi:site-specific recombinase XerD